MKHLFYLNKYFLKYKLHFLGGIFFVTLSNIFGLFPPLIVGEAIDFMKESVTAYQNTSDLVAQNLLRTKISKTLMIFAFKIFGLAIISGVFMYLMRQTIVVMSRRIEYDLKNEIYQQYQRLSLGFYKKSSTGDLMNRATEDVSKVRGYLGPAVLHAANLITLFTLTIGTMLSINKELTLYTLIPLPILALAIYYVNFYINKRSEIIQKQLSTLTSFCQESFSGIRVLKSFVKEKLFYKNFSNESEKYKVVSLNLVKVQALFLPFMVLLIGCSVVIVIYVGGLKVAEGTLKAGVIATFIIYVTKLTWPVSALGWVANIVQQAAASQQRINEFLKIEPEIVSNNKNPFTHNGAIEFKNVNFTYDNTGIEAIKNFDLKINAGEKVAIIGKTGSGKSTIAELILRIYDVTSGEILVNGNNIKKLNLESLRSQIGYIPQDVFLFSDTIYKNVAFGVDESSLDQVKNATKTASIDTEIESLPNKFKTLVGERGVTLSGGQKQRISIARALVSEVPVLLLDDCLSAVDANTEKAILDNFNNSWKEKTVIFITHRIFSIMDFDKIAVIDDGKIAAIGTHDNLLKTNELYKELYDLQQQD